MTRLINAETLRAKLWELYLFTKDAAQPSIKARAAAYFQVIMILDDTPEVVIDFEGREVLDPRLLTYEEIRALPVASVVWEEFYNGEEKCFTQLYPAMKTETGALVSSNGETDIEVHMGEPDADGNFFRWWQAHPTLADRISAAKRRIGPLEGPTNDED